MTNNFMGRRNQYIQLVKILYCKLPTIGKKTTVFPTQGLGFEPLTSEVGGECVNTVSPWDPLKCMNIVCIYLFGFLCRFQHCTGHITMGSWKGRGNEYIQFVRVLYCKLPTNGKKLPAFPLGAVPGTEPWPQKWEGRVLPLCHRGPEYCL